MKSAFIKITALVLALSTAASGFYLALPVTQVDAQAGKATACAAGFITAGISALAAIPQNILGVPKSQAGDTAQNVTTGGSANALSFNECILKPLAKIMIIALIRNIGASVVNWVNSGFQGKPLFVTDFQGTLLDAADQAAGQFIEGSDLGFMCKDFSFQIRLALALKYSQPFQQRATCTLSQIGKNATNFANNNGGVGWDNFLQVTTEPQNNVYGAYVIADSELAQRMAQAAGVKEKKISLGQGFLDFETCDEYETPSEVSQRLKSGGTFQAMPTGSGVLKSSGSSGYQAPGSSIYGSLSSLQGQPGSGVLKSTGSTPSAATQFASSIDSKPKCLKSSTKTPGTIIAGKLNSEFAKGDIQQAVAQEIDDVIAATMNQIAQKMIQGAGGLLGLSRKSSVSSQSYYDKYQSQYYGTGATTAQIGATSPTEDYTVGDYGAAASLVQGDPQVQQIYNATGQTANQAVQQNQAQLQAINNSVGGGDTSSQDIALFKTTSQSSEGDGLSANAVNGVKDGAVDQYNKPAATGEEQNPWWQVDLGSAKPITEVRIWRVTNKPVSQTLEKIRVVATDAGGQNAWTSDYLTPTESSPNPIVVPVNLTREFIKVEKQGTLDEQCRLDPGYRDAQVYQSCYHPLELVEVEAMSPVSIGSTTSFSTASSTGGSASLANDGASATSTVSWVVATPAVTVDANSPLAYELRLTAQKPVSGLQISSTLLRNGSAVPFLSVFSSTDFTYGTVGGQTATYSVSSPTVGTITLNNVAVDAGGYYLFKQSGPKNPNAQTGSYTIETSVSDSAGNLLQTQSSDFIVQ